MTWILVPIPNGVMTSPALMQQGVVWYCLNTEYYAFLTPNRDLILSGEHTGSCIKELDEGAIERIEEKIN